MTTTNNPLSATIEMRALKFMEQGQEPIEAVKSAIEEENNFIWLLMGVDMKSGRSSKDIAKEVKDHLCHTVYNRLTDK